MYLRKINRTACKLLHDVVLDHTTKQAAARTKLRSILKPNEVSEILKGAVDHDHDEWITEPWNIPAVRIWGKIFHKYDGMTNILTGTMDGGGACKHNYLLDR